MHYNAAKCSIIMKYFNLKQIKNISLILVLSFFVLHKIYLVIAGIIIALFDLNIDYIINLIKLIKRDSDKEKIGINRLIDRERETKDIKIKDNRLTLVEEIEHLGYIPSIEKENDTNAA